MRRRLFLSLAVAAFAAAAFAQPAPPLLEGPALAAALREGGYVLYLRHTSTDFGQNDEQMTDYANCAQQRNLTDRGREHARAIGEAIRALAIPIGPVVASPYCRTMETATLAFGAADRADAVREPGPAPAGSKERFTALRGLLSTAPPAGTNEVVVGHAYPFFSLVGGQYLDEGQAAVIRPQGASFEVVARVWLKEWHGLAQLPRKSE